MTTHLLVRGKQFFRIFMIFYIKKYVADNSLYHFWHFLVKQFRKSFSQQQGRGTKWVPIYGQVAWPDRAVDGLSVILDEMTAWNSGAKLSSEDLELGGAGDAIILIYCTRSPIKRALRSITPVTRTSPSSERILTTDGQRGHRQYIRKP